MTTENIKDAIKTKLLSPEGGVVAEVSVSLQSPRAGWDNPAYTDTLEDAARNVMATYQNANKWLDTLKEHILINLGCPIFSEIVHELAHTMPKRFDAFGDILHRRNLLVPYPTTQEWTDPIGDMKSCISIIYRILSDIEVALKEFKRVSEECGCNFSSLCDSLIDDISSEYPFFYRVEVALEHERNLFQWDLLCSIYKKYEH